MARVLITLLAFVGLVSCVVEFQQFEGKTADPCNRFLVPYLNPDCDPDTQWADPTVTVLIPTSTSPGNVPAGASLYSRPLTISGSGFQPATSAAAGTLALATSEDTCRRVEPSLQVQAIVPIGQPRFMIFSIPAGWDTEALEIEDRPRLLCWSPETNPNPNSFRYTGFKIGVVRNCEADFTSGASDPKMCGARTAVNSAWDILTPFQREARIQRNKCCRGTIPLTIGAGQCVNPLVQGCCGAAAYELSTQKCCNAALEIVTQLDAPCPCQEDTDCPNTERCCQATKFPDLIERTDEFGTGAWRGAGLHPVWPFARGSCYKPSRMRCCDTGNVYDPGSHQCCRINGVQSVNQPCPCNVDLDCVGSQYPTSSRTYNHTCCKQTAPTLLEAEWHEADTGRTDQLACSIYNNYPSGTGPRELQRCLGSCMDPNYQICCNGAACIKEYERCCNSTCCNKWTSSCFYGFHGVAVGQRANAWNYGTMYEPEMYEMCSSIEFITTIKGFWIFVLPAILLLASHIGLALVFVFASKATPRSFSLLEVAMMFVAIVVSYLAMPLFFSPNWKYPVFIIFAQLLVFATAAARIWWLNVVCVIVQFGILLYVFDPFHGNAILTTASNRYANGTDDVMTSGLLHSITKSWHTVEQARREQWCTKFYDYFAFDPVLRDFERRDNPQVFTFGYCSRAFGNALLLLSGGVMAGILLQLILSLLGIFFRFHYLRSEVELEVLEEHPY